MRCTTNCALVLLTLLIAGTPVWAGDGPTDPFPARGPVDGDGDGVPDTRDRCPDTPAYFKVDPGLRIAAVFEPRHLSGAPVTVLVDEFGCPLDGDGDGIPDHLDFCPENAPIEISAGVTTRGCALQSDGDGTPDYRDRCPHTPRGVATDRFGCPAGKERASLKHPATL